MKKTLLIGTILLATTSALAFSGMIDRITGNKSNHHSGGVNAIGVHVDENSTKPADIDIRSCDSETEELVGSECLPKCPDGIERNTDNSCSVCAGENANVYLSYMDAPCGTETPMERKECETGTDCWERGTDTCCNHSWEGYNKG